MKITVITASIVLGFLFIVSANNVYKDFMKEDDLKRNEFADFDAFDEDDDFETDIKLEEEKTEQDEQPSSFSAEDAVVEVILAILAVLNINLYQILS